MITYYDRKEKKLVEEIQYEEKILDFLYETALGRLCLKSFVARPWFSRMKSRYQKSRRSAKDILPFAEKYGIPLTPEASRKFGCFNDFFTRPHSPLPNSGENRLTAPADAKLSVYPISEDLKLTIKHTDYSVKDLVEDAHLAALFRGGTCLVYRLSADENHHYFYVDTGSVLARKKIKGVLHTVRPIAADYRVFARNSREVTVLSTVHFGCVVQIEVGALLVGKINNRPLEDFIKNEEKGFFEFGGSTIVQLLQRPLRLDDDIVRMNGKGFETKVYAGEEIGTIC